MGKMLVDGRNRVVPRLLILLPTYSRSTLMNEIRVTPLLYTIYGDLLRVLLLYKRNQDSQ